MRSTVARCSHTEFRCPSILTTTRRQKFPHPGQPLNLSHPRHTLRPARPTRETLCSSSSASLQLTFNMSLAPRTLADTLRRTGTATTTTHQQHFRPTSFHRWPRHEFLTKNFVVHELRSTVMSAETSAMGTKPFCCELSHPHAPIRTRKHRGSLPHVSPDNPSTLPLVLLGIRSVLRQDLQCSVAELVYGTSLRLPGEF